jgi:flavin-dependent dehydrogenase
VKRVEGNRHSKEVIHISGAGPAGLAAAITIAKSGRKAIVYERKTTTGTRFHNDCQGLENWTTRNDVLDELAHAGIEPGFQYHPFRTLSIFDANGKPHRYKSKEPLFYLVRRGPAEKTLDTYLRSEAEKLGVEFHFGTFIRKLPQGGIVAEGPKGGDVIATGYVFETDMETGAYAAYGERLAPGGYAYLLVHEGYGTLATCLFRDFHNESVYVQRCLDFFQEKLGLSMFHERRFGGLGNVLYPRTAVKRNILFAGEAAGFQDALWGFGMRYAILSGHLAARALLTKKPLSYDSMWKSRFGGILKAGIVNRWRFNHFSDSDYCRLLADADREPDIRDWMHRQCRASYLKTMIFPLAAQRIVSARKQPVCPKKGCDCTWCRCRHATR